MPELKRFWPIRKLVAFWKLTWYFSWCRLNCSWWRKIFWNVFDCHVWYENRLTKFDRQMTSFSIKCPTVARRIICLNCSSWIVLIRNKRKSKYRKQRTFNKFVKMTGSSSSHWSKLVAKALEVGQRAKQRNLLVSQIWFSNLFSFQSSLIVLTDIQW